MINVFISQPMKNKTDEKNLAEVNRSISGLETVLLYTLPEFGHISSSIVRELIRYGRDVSSLLPDGYKL